ncbi:hypothetical protein DID88_006909 [Monilinia fructigena]|uniref:Uncharacterized protein n=1 Tax=Monilinia fructigena TaxID=38457 RepID=A0A395IHB9_9HELO|nr:hypothetical protein DID88_006909 [Monilinia fructigena]
MHDRVFLSLQPGLLLTSLKPLKTASASSPLTNPNPNTTSSSHPSYPQAHPAAAVPHPTGLTDSSSQLYAPAVITGTDKPQTTRTIKEDPEVPPTPQPAAFPKPTTGFAGRWIRFAS